MAEEALPIYQKLGNVKKVDTVAGVTVRAVMTGEDELFVATSGVGEIRAALAVQLLKDVYSVEAIVNFGFVGALANDLDVGSVVIADKVCHYQFDTSALDGVKAGQYDGKDDVWFVLDEGLVASLTASESALRRVSVASGDVFVAGAETKHSLREDFGAQICDMELAGIAIAAERNGLPLVSIKVVSDRADDSAPESFSSVVKKGLSRYEELLPAIIRALNAAK